VAQPFALFAKAGAVQPSQQKWGAQSYPSFMPSNRSGRRGSGNDLEFTRPFVGSDSEKPRPSQRTRKAGPPAPPGKQIKSWATPTSDGSNYPNLVDWRRFRERSVRRMT
jgi:hypothetical protein